MLTVVLLQINFLFFCFNCMAFYFQFSSDLELEYIYMLCIYDTHTYVLNK